MSQSHQRRSALYLDVQLFPQLTIQCLPDRLTPLQFAAGKLPQPTLVQMIGPLSDQYLAEFVEDYPDCNVQYVWLAVFHRWVF